MILLIALATLSPIGVILYQNHDREEKALADGRVLSERLAAEAAYDQQLLLSSAKQMMSAFSFNPAIRRRDAAATNAFLARLLRENPQITNLLVADEKGNVWASGLPMKTTFNAADRRYFRNVMATARFSSGDYTVGRVRNKPTILFGYPLTDGSGRVTDVAVVSLSSDRYERLFQSKDLATEASLSLFDYKGTVLYARPSSALAGQQDREDLFRKMTAGPDEGSFDAVGLTGARRVFFYRKLRLPGELQPYMYVRTGISVSSSLDRTRKDFLIGMGTIAGGAVLILLFSVLLIKRSVLDKVAALTDATRRLSRGDLAVRVPESVSGGELGELGNAFNQMANRLQEADTKRQEAEETIRQSGKEILESQNLLHAVMNGTTDAVYVKDLQGRYLLFNAAASRITGKSAAEVVGKDDTFLFPPEEARAVMEGDRGVIDSREVMTYEEHVTTAGGKMLTFLSTKGPVIDEHGDMTGLFGVARDITERKRAAVELTRAARDWQRTFDATNDAIWILDRDQHVMRSNKSAAQFFPSVGDGFLGRHCYEIVHKTSEPHPECPLIRSKTSLRRESMELLQGDRWFEIIVDPILDEEGRFDGAVHIVSDITERKRAEESIKLSEERFRVLSEQSPLGMVLIDHRGRYEYANPAFVSMFGYTVNDLPTGADWFRAAFPDPEARERAMRAWRDDLANSSEGEARLRNFDVTCKDGTRKSIRFRPVSLSSNRQFVIYEDVTRQRELQAQLHQAMKMEAVGRLAGGVAHDFNNLLTVILGNVSLALGKVQPSAPIAGMLSEVSKAAERAAALTQQLLAFSRKQIIEPRVLNLNDLIADLNAMLVRLVREDIKIRFLPGKDIGSVKVDAGQFQQVLANLVVNARDALPDGGQIVIETSNAELDDGYCSMHPHVKPGKFVMMTVSDTGLGMSEEVKSHIFEPFFTTKAKGSGTGLGLATTYGAVKQAGGSIEVYSEVGTGTTFKIYLPRVEDEVEKPVKNDHGAVLPGGTETVLVVEDEDLVRTLCVRILERLGYKVMQARSGAQAIEVAQSHGESIDLLLTDVVMPGMNGAELATQMVLHYPEMKVLFTSGYTDDVISHRRVLEKGVSFIGKPYTPAALARKVREVLGTTGNNPQRDR